MPLECVKSIFQKGTIWQFWYLGALLILYLLLPILSRLTKMRKVFLVGTGAIAVIIELTAFYLKYPVQKYVVQTLRLRTWIFYLLLGSEISKIQKWILQKQEKDCMRNIFMTVFSRWGGLFFYLP